MMAPGPPVPSDDIPGIDAFFFRINRIYALAQLYGNRARRDSVARLIEPVGEIRSTSPREA